MCLTFLVAVASCAANESEVPDRLTGVITEIEPDDPSTEPTSFSLEAEGRSYSILIADDVDYGFDLAHLHEHLADEDPVDVQVEERNGDVYALSIVDARPG